MMAKFLAAITLITSSRHAYGCSSDDDCSLNGLCGSNATCACFAPWGGDDCGVLNFLPAPTTGAFGDMPAPENITSWGGNAEYDQLSSKWHGYFTEIGGKECGLTQWRTHSTVVHAESATPEGPYARVAGAAPVLLHEAHNPQVLRLNDTHWYIFHIGNADANGTSAAACPGGVGPPVPPGKMPTTVHPIHESTTGPAGPFAPAKMAGKFGDSCNNPSPYRHTNGTFFLACTWSLRSAPSPRGPWTAAWSIAPKGASGHQGREWLGRFWEDVFIYVDARGHWHLLAHTYIKDQYPAQSISGHGFSRDGHHWNYSRTEPYSGAVVRADGSVKTYATMERPKLLFADPADPLRPTHLLNGASPVWDMGNATNPCGACETGACVKCKVSPGMDWTYTVARPLAPARGRT